MLPKETAILILPFILYSYFKYIKSIFDGTNRPNIVTWTLWFVAPLLAFFASFSTGVTIWEGLMAFSAGICSLAVVVSCLITQKLQLKFTKLDIFCFFLSVLGIAIWYFTKDPIWALVLSLVVDFVSGIPTVLKSYQEPQFENPIVYFPTLFNTILTLFILQSFTIFSLAFPVYSFCFNILILFPLIKFRLQKSN
jgi:hypothetical protein